MEPMHEVRSTWQDRVRAAGPTVMAAVVILGTLALAQSWVSAPKAVTTALVPTEDWPTAFPSFTPLPAATPRGRPLPTVTPTATPLPAPVWNELSYLTTIEYRANAIVELERKRPVVGDLLGSDRILLLAVSRIRMGVDLGDVKPADVRIQGRALSVGLPHAQVISVELLPDESRIYDYQQSFLFSQYKGLEVEALEKARQQLLESASANGGMLALAEEFARLQLSEFLRKAGFDRVEVTFRQSE